MVLLFAIPFSFCKPEKENKLDAIRFHTDYNQDPTTSEYKTNFVSLAANNSEESSTEITFCLKLNTFSTLQQCIFEDFGLSFVFTSEKYGFVRINGIWIMFQFKKDIVPLKWNHICISYDNGYVIMMMNGDALVDEKFAAFDEIPDKSISLNDTFTLGICWDRVLNNDGPLLSITRGLVTCFNFWAQALSKEQMEKMTTDCTYSINDQTLKPVIQWNELNIVDQGEMASNVTILPGEVCGIKENQTTSIILPIKQSYQTCKKSCENLGGKLPLYHNQDDLQNIPNTISQKNKKDKKGAERIKSQCGQEIWIPIIQGEKIDGKDEYFWKEDVGNDSSVVAFMPWELSQPNGQDLQQCVTLSFKTVQYTDIACDREFCCLCEFSGEVTFHLHGIPSENNEIDTSFIFVPEAQDANELKFTGYKRNQISWKSEDEKWFLLDKSKLEKPIGYHNITQETVLIGMHDWILVPEENAVDQTEKQLPLKLSKVPHLFLVYMYHK